MNLPSHIQRAITDVMRDISHQTYYHLYEEHRHAIYRALHPSLALDSNPFLTTLQTHHLPMSFEHVLYGHLALITANQVLSFWEYDAPLMLGFESEDVHLPRRMLAVAEELIHGTIPVAEVLPDFCGRYHAFEDMWDTVRFETYWAGDAAHAALSMVLGIPPCVSPRALTACPDAAAVAAMAYSTTDLTYPRDRSTHQPFFMIDEQRRHAFWHWWLTVAIPEAWARAQSSKT